MIAATILPPLPAFIFAGALLPLKSLIFFSMFGYVVRAFLFWCESRSSDEHMVMHRGFQVKKPGQKWGALSNFAIPFYGAKRAARSLGMRSIGAAAQKRNVSSSSHGRER